MQEQEQYILLNASKMNWLRGFAERNFLEGIKTTLTFPIRAFSSSFQHLHRAPESLNSPDSHK